ncbi:flagellar biosynthesis protein FlhA [Helicobacter cinaedi]|uniref:Flagellar biosynthesis protein FlhA n=1 Tax=Helicobacter cinaedi TaxID=213 RepID=A0A377JTK9_9HELI|nr:flagellar biosynthesis protein FlhA [Helicobacter cinaedi]STP09802.1 flagellar biosynthesis protein [Helicobacter cinaedi]STP10585.1 flagellar biosynthesis protein [Helicobacter cinaedi]
MTFNTASILDRITPFFKNLSQSTEMVVIVFMMLIVAIIIVPLPSAMLDFLLSISIALSILIILITLYVDKATEFSAFPTILLIVTLYRLALNVATTRMILSEGHNGVEAVSSIVSAFGHFVVGGNYVIGIIVFTILVIVNLIVITNGSTRVTEVRARFTLDAMPGKQMAIDADLNAGLIGQDEAQKRRDALAQEADFYGTMDGASKFVKGDAIASIIITIVNIIGGFLIGVFEHGMSVKQSAETFTILTIGDGLVGQIPALIVATATGIITTRAAKSSQTNFAGDIITQITGSSKILSIVGFILILFALVPGLPISLGFVGAFFLAVAWLVSREDMGSLFSMVEKFISKKAPPNSKKADEDSQKEIDINQHKAQRVQKSEEEIKKEEEAIINEALKVETLEIYLGYQLIRLADVKQNGDLLERIRSMRKKIATDYGFLIPQIRIKDNLNLQPTDYEVLLKGVKIGEGSVLPDKFLAMDTGMVAEAIDGIPTKEPAFGLDALWIDSKDKEEAIIRGYHIIDPSTIVTTHMTELIKTYAEEFITKDEVKVLMDRHAKDYPVVVGEASKIPMSVIIRVLRELLHEKIPIKDLPTILESITDTYPILQDDTDSIVEQVRSRLARTITDIFKAEDGNLKIFTLSLATEQYLIDRLKEQPGGKNFVLHSNEVQKLVDSIQEESLKLIQKNMTPVLLVDYRIRKPLVKLLEPFRVNITILGNAEIDPHATFEVVGTLNIEF